MLLRAVMQAVAEGDAMKADKRRKKKQREEEAAVDPIFGGSDEDDGGDYNPDAAEEPEYIETGVDNEAPEEEAGEAFASDGEAENSEENPRPSKSARKRLLVGTGTGTSFSNRRSPF